MKKLAAIVYSIITTLILVFTLCACSTIMPRQLASEQKKWEAQTQENTFLELFDFSSRKNLKIQRMVQVGTKDGAPVYDFVEEADPEKPIEKEKAETANPEVEEANPKAEEEGEKGSQPKLEKKQKAIVDAADSEEYLKAIANIRKQKIEKVANTKKKVSAKAVDTKLHVAFDGVEKYQPRIKGRQGQLTSSGSQAVAQNKEEEFKITLDKVKEAFNAGLKVYAQEEYVDNQSEGAKGAAHLVWTKFPKGHAYQIEILRGNNLFSIVQTVHVMHVMLFWDKEYVWRVRVMDETGRPRTAFTEWKLLKVTHDPAPQIAEVPEDKPIEVVIPEDTVPVYDSAPESERDPAHTELQDLFMDVGE